MLHDIRLLSGLFPVLLGVAAGAAIAATIGRHPRWRAIGVVGLVTGLIVAGLRLALPASVDVARIPPTFYVWAGIPLAAGGLALVSWRSAGPLRRAASVAAVPLALVFSAGQVNTWFAYMPTAADLIGAPLPQEVPWPTLLGQGARSGGSVARVDIPATRSGFRHRRAALWLPPGRHRPGATTPRVVMMLAGTPGRPTDLISAAGMGRAADAFAASHGGAAPILVFPDHNGSFWRDTECVDGPRGNAETYLTADVPAFMSATFGVPATGWGVLGYSEGGTCAVMLALRHPELFDRFVDIGGDLRPNVGTGPARQTAAITDLFGGDRAAWAAHDPVALLAARRFDGLRGWFIAGSGDDPARRNASQLAEAARSAGIDACYLQAPGRHSFQFVSSVAPAALAWIAGDPPPPAAGVGASSPGTRVEAAVVAPTVPPARTPTCPPKDSWTLTGSTLTQGR